jgi:hypothetical protein
MCNSNQISILGIQISRGLPEIISEVKIYYVSGEFQTEREYVLVLNKKIKKLEFDDRTKKNKEILMM